MRRRRWYAAALVPVLPLACASSTVIRSAPPGARVYLDGAPVGRTPYTMTDSRIVGSTTSVRIEHPGYETVHTSIRRDEEFDVGACIGGLLVLVPLLWIMKYRPEHYYELSPLHSAVAAPAPLPPPDWGTPPGAAPAPAPALRPIESPFDPVAEPERRLAALEFRGKGLDPDVLAVLADAARAGALVGADHRRVLVMTRESTAAILKDMGRPDCREGDCEVETARSLGAHLVVTGEVTRIDGAYMVTLKLHETARGALLASEQRAASRPLALVEGVREASARMVEAALARSEP